MDNEKQEEEEFYLNPKAKKMCGMCYDRKNCEQTPDDIIFCKLNIINVNLSKMLQK